MGQDGTLMPDDVNEFPPLESHEKLGQTIARLSKIEQKMIHAIMIGLVAGRDSKLPKMIKNQKFIA